MFTHMSCIFSSLLFLESEINKNAPYYLTENETTFNDGILINISFHIKNHTVNENQTCMVKYSLIISHNKYSDVGNSNSFHVST